MNTYLRRSQIPRRGCQRGQHQKYCRHYQMAKKSSRSLNDVAIRGQRLETSGEAFSHSKARWRSTSRRCAGGHSPIVDTFRMEINTKCKSTSTKAKGIQKQRPKKIFAMYKKREKKRKTAACQNHLPPPEAVPPNPELVPKPELCCWLFWPKPLNPLNDMMSIS